MEKSYGCRRFCTAGVRGEGHSGAWSREQICRGGNSRTRWRREASRGHASELQLSSWNTVIVSKRPGVLKPRGAWVGNL